MLSKGAQKIQTVLEPSIEKLGYELVYVEFTSNNKRQILRVYIDAPGGIDVNDCAKVSEEINVVLDVENIIDLAYDLEVSSPGVDRPLVKKQHFMRFVGYQAKIITCRLIDGRRKFRGDLAKATEHLVTINVDEESYNIRYEDIESARLTLSNI